MRSNEFLGSLKTALERYQFDEARELTRRINPASFKPRQAEETLDLLRRKRLFEELEHTACMFEFSGVESAKLRRLWAQSLIEQKRTSQALLALRGMKKNVAGDPGEKSEAQGLIGRAHKQLYVDEGAPEHLAEAIRTYRTAGGPGKATTAGTASISPPC